MVPMATHRKHTAQPKQNENLHHFDVGSSKFAVEVTEDDEGRKALTVWKRRDVTAPETGPDPEERWDDVFAHREGDEGPNAA